MRHVIPPWTAPLGLSLALATTVSFAGCSDDQTSADSDGTEDEEGEAGEDEGELLEGPPALGIHITEVEANQGTAILIGQDGEWVDGPGRNAFMIRDRDTLVRLQHTVDPGWVPREIVGVLHVRDPEGNELEPRVRTFMVEGDSEPRNLNTNFYFSVLAEEAQPGATYWVELLEADDGSAASALSEGVNTTPPDYELIGYELTPLEMKVMLVPIEYTYIQPPTLVVPTEDDLQLFHDELLQQNPLQTVDFEVHEPYTWDNQLTNLGSLLSPMSALRANENAEPNVYYHALVDVNGPSVAMVAGIAQLAGSGKANALSRVAATVFFKQGENPPGGSAGTFVHEVGHNQGLAHVFCSQASSPAAGPDPSYPHDDGTIGVYGFGIRNFKLYTPNAAHDYMTYCGNSWVSDWTWNKTYSRIRELTGWDYEGGAADDPTTRVPLLVGTLYPDGGEDWWVMMGPAPEPEDLGAEHRLAYMTGGQVADQVLTRVDTLTDGATTIVTAPLTVPLDEIEGVARIDWHDESHAIDLSTIRGREYLPLTAPDLD